MMTPRLKKGVSLTALTAFVAYVMIVLASFFGSLRFFTRSTAGDDVSIQQAYYNANSGVEYARFIIEHGTVYNPLNAAGSSSYLAWPQGQTFNCFPADSSKGNVTVNITSNVTGGYDIASTGRVKNEVVPLNVHVTAGKVFSWR